MRLAAPLLAAWALAACASGAAAQPRGAPGLAGRVISFEDHGGLVLLPVRVNGGPPGLFVLDTGAAPCVLDAALARRLGLRTEGAAAGKGGAGAFRAEVVRDAVALTLDGARVPCRELRAVDLAGVGEGLGRRIDGVLGGDFFRGAVVRVDYDARTVEVHDRRAYWRRGGGARVPIAVRGNRPYLRAGLAVPGGAEAERELLVDTGSQDAVDDSLLLRSHERLSRGRGTGLGEGFEVRRGRFSRVRIGPFVFRDVAGVVPAVPIVGAGILSRFRLTFDYDGGWMALEPRRPR